MVSLTSTEQWKSNFDCNKMFLWVRLWTNMLWFVSSVEQCTVCACMQDSLKMHWVQSVNSAMWNVLYVIWVNKYKHLSEIHLFLPFSVCPVTSVELSISVFIIPNNTRYPPQFSPLAPISPTDSLDPTENEHTLLKSVSDLFHTHTHTCWILLFAKCYWFIMWTSRFIYLNGADRCVYLYTPQRNKEMRARCVCVWTSGSPLSRSHRSFSVENPNRRLFIYRNWNVFKFCQNCPSRAAHLS